MPELGPLWQPAANAQSIAAQTSRRQLAHERLMALSSMGLSRFMYQQKWDSPLFPDLTTANLLFHYEKIPRFLAGWGFFATCNDA
jgi:hypothetical protein